MVDPTFPGELNVTASVEGIEFDQYEDEGIIYIQAMGTSTEEQVTLTLEVPEGWDGFVGYKMDFGGYSMNEWPTLDEFEETLKADGVEEILMGNEFTFTADSGIHMMSLYPYVGDKVGVDHGVALGFMVDYEKSDVAVNVEVVDGAAFNYTLPMNTASGFSLNLPAEWEVKSALLNGEEIEVADKYTVAAGEEDLDYVFEVEYTGEFVVVDSTTGMVELDTTVKIGIVDGKIRIENTSVGDAIVVYSVGGMVVGRYTAQDTAEEITVASGTYIVTVNQKAAKVLVP